MGWPWIRRVRPLGATTLVMLLVLPFVVGAPRVARAQIDSREGIALQNQLYQLRQEVQSLRGEVGRGGGGGGDIAAQLLSRVQSMEEQVRQLRGRIDETRNLGERHYNDLQKRVEDLTFQLSLSRGGPQPGNGAAVPPPVAPTVSQPSSSPPREATPRPAPDRPFPERTFPDRPFPDRPTSERPLADRPPPEPEPRPRPESPPMIALAPPPPAVITPPQRETFPLPPMPPPPQPSNTFTPRPELSITPRPEPSVTSRPEPSITPRPEPTREMPPPPPPRVTRTEPARPPPVPPPPPREPETASPAPPPLAPEVTATALPPGGKRTPEMALQEGQAALGRRDYTAAERAAREVMSNRASPRGYDGQFLLAQALAGQKQHAQSAIAFDDAYNRSRKGRHAQDALLGLAGALTAINERKAACETLARLRTEFPQVRADLKDTITRTNERAACGR